MKTISSLDTMRALRAPILFGAIFAFIMLGLPQTQEILGADIATARDHRRLYRAYGAIFIFCVILLSYATELINHAERTHVQQMQGANTRPEIPFDEAIGRWWFPKYAPFMISGCVWFLSLLAALIGINNVKGGFTLTNVGIISVAAFFGFLILHTISYLEHKVASFRARGVASLDIARHTAMDTVIPLIMLSTIASLYVLLLTNVNILVERLGAITLAALFCSAVFVFYMRAQKIATQAGRPYIFIWLLLTLGGMLALSGMQQEPPLSGSSYLVRPLTNQSHPPRQAEAVWGTRPSLAGRTNEPTYFVMAQGGGMYAGYHSALSLAKIFDAYEGSYRRIAAISGVSGGALGAGVAVAAAYSVDKCRKMLLSAQTGAPTPCKLAVGVHENLVRAFFKSDFISVLGAGALLYDVINVVAPYKLFPPIGKYWPDRATALEDAISARWDETVSKVLECDPCGDLTGFFDLPISGYRDADKSLPILVFLAATVESGEPVIVSQVDLSGGDIVGSRTHDFLSIYKAGNVRISTAIVLSSRFPYITPAATIDGSSFVYSRKLKHVRLVDGGYYEASGAFGLIAFFGKAGINLSDGTSESRILVFKNGAYQGYDGSYLSELLVPFRAIMNAGNVNGNELLAQVERICVNRCKLLPYSLLDNNFSAPLSWYMSERTREGVEERSFLGGDLGSRGNEILRADFIKSGN